MTSKSPDNPSTDPIQPSESSLEVADVDPGAGQKARDTLLVQKWQAFNRSKPQERVVHSAGSGAIGYFECTKDMSKYTKADLYNGVGKRTRIFMRFSTALGGKESPDQGRGQRGFAIKHYIKEDNYDIVGLNWPIFFCRDPMQGPDVFLSQQRNPKNFLLDHDAMFEFLGNFPESNHAAMMFFSNHGHPKGWRRMHGYGCHAFKWVNKEGKFVYVKYHFICDQGSEQLTRREAIEACGEDPDFSKRDLWQAIEKGEPITWTAKVQIMKPEQADPVKLGFDPFDVTKIWPKKDFPLQDFGRLVLDENPENYHREVEKSAFSPRNMVPGIEESPDMLLQLRMTMYRDAQNHRLGTNFHETPVNCPLPSSGSTNVDFDGSGAYSPSHSPDTPRHDAAQTSYEVPNKTVSRQSHHYSEGTHKEYDQPRELYDRVMSAEGRADLHHNTATVLKLVQDPVIQIRYLAQCYRISSKYAQGIYDLLPEPGFDFEDVGKMAEDAPSFGKVRESASSKESLSSVPAGERVA